jgi:hypothetical protein
MVQAGDAIGEAGPAYLAGGGAQIAVGLRTRFGIDDVVEGSLRSGRMRYVASGS